MSYDVDIAVIGAGPAGLAAAVRARWVKTAQAVPASVVLLDPAGFGGIARMGTIALTGPSFTFQGPDLISRLVDDVTQLEIPLVREAVLEIHREDACWIVRTAMQTLTCLAVVLATGLRRLANEIDLVRNGKLVYLSGGYARAARAFTTWSSRHQGQHLLLIGGATLTASLDDFLAFDAGRNRIEALCEPQQRIDGYALESERIRVTVTENGHTSLLDCDQVMLDYHSLEISPPALAFLPAELKSTAGYSLAGPRGLPAYPGLFGAGDCAGQPSLCLKALAEGSEAGFMAYRHVYREKFGGDPLLFAFYVAPQRPAFDGRDLPVIDPARHYPVGLSRKSHFTPLSLSTQFPHAASREPEPLDQAQLDDELAGKTATVHVVTEYTGQ